MSDTEFARLCFFLKASLKLKSKSIALLRCWRILARMLPSPLAQSGNGVLPHIIFNNDTTVSDTTVIHKILHNKGTQDFFFFFLPCTIYLFVFDNIKPYIQGDITIGTAIWGCLLGRTLRELLFASEILFLESAFPSI